MLKSIVLGIMHNKNTSWDIEGRRDLSCLDLFDSRELIQVKRLPCQLLILIYIFSFRQSQPRLESKIGINDLQKPESRTHGNFRTLTTILKIYFLYMPCMYWRFVCHAIAAMLEAYNKRIFYLSSCELMHGFCWWGLTTLSVVLREIDCKPRMLYKNL